ncbi:MAG: hypothetical protein ABFC34_10045 [Methanobacterium sp.]
MSNLLKKISIIFASSRLNKSLVNAYKQQFSSDYWTWKQKINEEKFRLKKLSFRTKNQYYSKKESSLIIISIIKLIFWEFLIAIIIVFLLELGQWILLQYGIIDLPQKITTTFTLGASHPIISQTNLITSINPNDILTTLAQISGIFLGLYFTAVGVVISTAYKDVPESVRSIVVREKIGNIYIEIVALLGSISILLLFLSTLGWNISILNLIFVSFLGIISILSFLILGIRTFNFFDPSALIDHLASKLARIIESKEISGNSWQDSHFQVYYRNEATKILHTYKEIVELTREHLQGKTLNKLESKALALLVIYLNKKQIIPYESSWFKNKLKFDNLLIMEPSSYSQITTSIKTNTLVTPKTVPNLIWFEDELIEILMNSMETHLKYNDLDSALTLADNINNTLTTISENLAIKEALNLYSSLSKTIRNSKRKEQDLDQHLIDYYVVWYMKILLGFQQGIESIDSNSFREKIKNIDWDNEKSIYNTKLPENTIRKLEKLQEMLSCEKEVEGKIITPLWYQIQFASKGFAEFIAYYLDKLITELDKTIFNYLSKLLASEQYYLSAHLLLRGLESYEKIHVEEIKNHFNQISSLQKFKESDWPVIDWESHNNNINQNKKKLISKLADIMPNIADEPYTGEYLDYFGHAYFLVTNECYKALFNKDEAFFKKMYNSLFYACLYGPNRILNSYSDFRDDAIAKLARECFITLIEMSGYAIIYSELYNVNYWKSVKKEWDDHLNTKENPELLIELLIQFANAPPSLTHQEIIRNEYENMLESKLEEHVGEFGYYMPPGMKREKHPSPIIRSITKSRLSNYGIRAVFLAKYILKRPEAKDIKLEYNTRDYVEDLKEEISQNESFVEHIKNNRG